MTSHVERGQQLLDARQIPEALAAFTEALAEDQNSVAAHLGAGSCYMKMQDFPRARDHFDKACELDPADLQAMYWRGTVANYLNNPHEAIAYLNDVIKAEPNHGHAWGRKGDAYYALRDLKTALECYNEAVRLCPSEVIPYYDRGNAYYQMARHDEAIADYSRALALGGTDADLYLYRAECYFAIGSREAAKADIQQILRDESAHESFRARASELGRTIEALESGTGLSENLGFINNSWQTNAPARQQDAARLSSMDKMVILTMKESAASSQQIVLVDHQFKCPQNSLNAFIAELKSEGVMVPDRFASDKPDKSEKQTSLSNCTQEIQVSELENRISRINQICAKFGALYTDWGGSV